MKTRLIFLLILIVILLAGCGPRPTGFESRANFGFGTLYELRDGNLNLIQSNWCWAWDKVCNGNPFGYPVPAGR